MRYIFPRSRPALVHEECAVTSHFARQSGAGLYFGNYFEFEGAVRYVEEHPREAGRMGQLFLYSAKYCTSVWTFFPMSFRPAYRINSSEIWYFAVFLFIPYMFGTTYYGMRVCPQKSVLVPCLHKESYMTLALYKKLFRGIGLECPYQTTVLRPLFFSCVFPYIRSIRLQSFFG